MIQGKIFTAPMPTSQTILANTTMSISLDSNADFIFNPH